MLTTSRQIQRVSLSKTLATFVLVVLLAACDQKSEHAQKTDDDEEPKSQETIAQERDGNDNAAVSDPSLDLLGDGFYTGENLSKAPNAQGMPENSKLGANGETSAGDKAAEVSSSLSTETPANSLPTNLVEDLGFSVSETDVFNKNKKQDLYCLSSSAKDTPIGDEICERISTRLSSVKLKACEAAELKATGCQSVKGFPIVLREFPPLDNIIPQGKILIIGGTHGDELTSVSVVLRWIEKLNQHHSGLYHWHIAPLMNPDGVLKPSATRTNENGIDLNRNMPSDDWTEKAIKYWTEKGSKDPRKFPGDDAASEPETKWLIDEINSFQPDAIISVHAPYGVVDFDSLLLNTAPKSLGKLHLNLLGTYPGSLGNYAGINLNIPVVTLELPHSWVMPSEKETDQIWQDLVGWLKTYINNDVAKTEK